MRRWVTGSVAVGALGALAAVAFLFAGGGPARARLTAPFSPVPPVVMRSSQDQVADTVNSVTISWTGSRPGLLRETNAATVGRLSHLLNALPEEGQGQCAEGLIEGPPFIVFVFRDRSGAFLARASMINSAEYPVAWCVPTSFQAAGQSTIRLEGGGYLLRQTRRLLERPLG